MNTDSLNFTRLNTSVLNDTVLNCAKAAGHGDTPKPEPDNAWLWGDAEAVLWGDGTNVLTE